MTIVPVERLTRRTESFRCEPYSAVISANTCLARQDAVADTRHGRKPAQYPRCLNCALGDAVAKRIANPTTPPPLAPEPTPTIDEAPVKLATTTKLQRKRPDPPAVTCGAHGCDNPGAKVRTDTLPETADFCAHDRLNARNRARDAGCTLGELAEMMRAGTWVASRGVARATKPTKTRAPKKAARKPAKASKRKPVSPLADVLARVKRDRAVVDELGGIDAAERFVDIVRHAGGPDAVFAFFDEVSA